MKINLQNYEEYFVRFLDGDLPSEEVAEVKLFLQQHPGLSAELKAFKATLLPADENLFFPDKELLKKGITLLNYQDYFIRKVEADLSSQEVEELNFFLQHHRELQGDMNAFEKTKLVADTSVGFPDKNSLKKRKEGRVIPVYVRYAFVAAVAAGLMLIMFMRGMPWQTPEVVLPVAEQSSTSTSSSHASHDDSNTNANEIESQLNTKNPDLASDQISNSAGENLADKINHPNITNGNEKRADLLADASPIAENTIPANRGGEGMSTGDMTKIGDEVTPISFQPRLKKALYREVPIVFARKNTVAENKSTMKFSSVATRLGSELLRLSGREDYLKSTSAFNATAVEKKKLPLVVSIKGNKFNFYHKFFKKRGQTSSESKKTEP